MDNDLKVVYGIWVFVVASLYVTIQLIPLVSTSGSLVVGINTGFVTEAPTEDPLGEGISTIDARSYAIRDTAPVGAIKVIEMGWWASPATEEADTEVGIYTHDPTNDTPNVLLGSATFAKGTTEGWKVKTGLNIEITAGTIYWLAAQCDDTATLTRIDNHQIDGTKRVLKFSPAQTELSNPWGESGAENDDYTHAIYAVVEVVVDTCTCAGAGNNWEIAMSDYCNITEACNLTTGKLSFTGAGYCNCNSTITTTNLGDPGASGILYIQDSCTIWVNG